MYYGERFNAWTHFIGALLACAGAVWLLVSAAVIAILNALLDRPEGTSAPAAALYLWVYFSSVLGHLVFFGLPGSAVTGGLLMGAVAIPFAVRLLRHARRPTIEEIRDQPAR